VLQVKWSVITDPTRLGKKRKNILLLKESVNKSNIAEKYKGKLEGMTLKKLEIVSEKFITSDTLEYIFN